VDVRVDIRVPVGLPLLETAAFIRGCEDAGFAGVGIHDHQHSGRDVYLALALAARQTTHLRLYPATSNPVTRHPAVLASLAHSLEELAPGRIALTLAPGFLAVRNIGHRRARVDELREAVLVIKRLLAGETVAIGGQETSMRNVSEPPTPVYLLAAGPRMVELAGEVADGALLMVGVHPNAIEAARRHLQAGAERAGRSLERFDVTYIVTMAVGDDPAQTRRWPQRWLAPGHPWIAYPSHSNFYWLREAGIPLPEEVQPEAVSDELADRICEAFGLFGTAEQCAAQLRQAVGRSSMKRVFIFPAHTQASGYDMPASEVEAFRDVIFPALRA
jgi:5,10-methylenetetrahydromethanopterin reductase